jgi:hypothetical protein
MMKFKPESSLRRWARRAVATASVILFLALVKQPELQPEAGEPQQAFVQFLVLLALSAVMFIASQLLAPKPDIEDARPKGIGDFSFPTATEGRQIPVVWGTCPIKGPNVIWFGDLRVEEIEEEVKTGLFSSDDVVVGFKYYVGMDMAICYGPITSLRRVKIGTETALPFSTYAGTGAVSGVGLGINQPNLFGGEGKGGGVVGTLQFYDGVPSQLPDSYLQGVLGSTNVPGYVDVCHAVWRQGLISESENIEPWEFEVSRFPNQLGLTTNRHIVSTYDSNPACALYEILTDEIWALDMDPGDIDTASFISAGNTLFTEGNGWSYVADRTSAAADIIKEILRQIDGVLYQDVGTGKFFLKLVRADYNPDLLAVYDESNVVAVENFSRAAWNQTQNSVEIQYSDRAKDYTQTSARAQDLANVRIQDGQQVLAQMTYPGIKTASTASALATRELRQLSYPLAKLRLTALRSAGALRPGDVIKFSWQRYGISNMILRVTQVALGDLDDSRVTIDCFEDIFAIGTALFNDAEPTNWTPIANLPAPANPEIVRDSPYWFILTDQVLQGTAGERLISFGARPNGLNVNYGLYTNTGPSSAYERVGASPSFQPTGTLVNSYAENTADFDTTGFLIQSVVDPANIVAAVQSDIQNYGRGLALIQGATPAGDEIIGFQTFTDLGGGQYRVDDVRRGLMDTLPAAHLASARIWFLTAGTGASSQRSFTNTESVSAKLRTATTTQDLDLASATARPITFASRASRPIPPGNFQVNTARYPTSIGAADAALTWAHRHRSDATIRFQGDASVTQDTDIEYELKFYDHVGAALIRTVVLRSSGIFSESPAGGSGSWVNYTYPRAQIKTDAGASAGAFVVRAELVARYITGGLTARNTIIRTFTVTLP